MAEVLGVVSSVITVVAVAGKIAPQLIALKRLWDEVQNIPETINDQLEQLEMLCPILDDMDNEFSKTRELLKSDNVAQKSFEYCRRAASELEALAERLQQQIASAKKSKRTIAKFRITLKKNMIEEHQRKLENALRLLMLSQSTYQMALTRLQPDLIVSKLSGMIGDPRDQDDTPVHPEQGSDSRPAESIQSPPERYYEKTDSRAISHRLPWREFNNLFQYCYRYIDASEDEAPHDGIHGHRAHVARLQLPSWLLQKAWDFQMQKANGMWNVTLINWNVRPLNSEIFTVMKRGDENEMFNLFRTRRASIYDCNPAGRTLLDYALLNLNWSMAMRLMEHLNPRTHVLPGSIYAFLHHGRRRRIPAAEDTTILRIMKSRGMFDSDDHSTAEEVIYSCLWWDPEYAKFLARELIPNFDLAGSDLRFEEISWYYVDPKILLQILDENRVQPAMFRAVLSKGRSSLFLEFAVIYFDFLMFRKDRKPENGELLFHRDILSWRRLASRIFSGALVTELSYPLEEVCRFSAQIGISPLIAAIADNCHLYSRKELGRTNNLNRRQDLARKAARVWLEDLASVGIDLIEYGKMEKKVFSEFKSLGITKAEQQARQRNPFTFGGREKSVPSYFTYGPKPEDWEFYWSSYIEDYAGDFWKVVEPSMMVIPGAWIEDDDEENY